MCYYHMYYLIMCIDVSFDDVLFNDELFEDVLTKRCVI